MVTNLLLLKNALYVMKINRTTLKTKFLLDLFKKK